MRAGWLRLEQKQFRFVVVIAVVILVFTGRFISEHQNLRISVACLLLGALPVIHLAVQLLLLIRKLVPIVVLRSRFHAGLAFFRSLPGSCQEVGLRESVGGFHLPHLIIETSQYQPVRAFRLVAIISWCSRTQEHPRSLCCCLWMRPRLHMCWCLCWCMRHHGKAGYHWQEQRAQPVLRDQLHLDFVCLARMQRIRAEHRK
mmetsp:Transcript_16775/g.46345  ORF Transcript_16775/g.46345 Transcript_16775/m.46345 type:complete len:201 (-) Transcript_16775:83-685(-)